MLLLLVVAAAVVDVVVGEGGDVVVWFLGRGNFLVLSEGFQTTIHFCITCGALLVAVSIKKCTYSLYPEQP